MPDFFVNGQAVRAERGQTVMQAALAAGFFIPSFCWHPHLSVAGNCRICVVEVEEDNGSNWIDIACNMPVAEGMRVLTDSTTVARRRKETLQLLLLNHPVDCAICDKAGECLLQDHHYKYFGERSVARDAKVTATKFHRLSERIILDNERCILCSRCVRFTHEVSKSCSLGIQHRGDHSRVRASEDGAFAADPYADNVIDLCPVGALLSTDFLYKSRVWYLQATPSVCPGCARGCLIDIWHRKPEWKLNALDPRQNTAIARVTPRADVHRDAHKDAHKDVREVVRQDARQVAHQGSRQDAGADVRESAAGATQTSGPWICNKGRDLARIFERPRAEQALLKGRPVELATAVAVARRLIDDAAHPLALVSNWGSNEELAAFERTLGRRFRCRVKTDHRAQSGEPIEDDFLIKADKNPNTQAAIALFGERGLISQPGAAGSPAHGDQSAAGDVDLVLVWGEGCDIAELPRGAKLIVLGSYLAPENGHADVFIPISIQTERAGHYTNFAGRVSRFEACFDKKPTVAHTQALFAQIALDAKMPA